MSFLSGLIDSDPYITTTKSATISVSRVHFGEPVDLIFDIPQINHTDALLLEKVSYKV